MRWGEPPLGKALPLVALWLCSSLPRREALEHFQLLRDDLSAKGGAERSWRLELQAMRGLGDAHEAMGETRLAFQCYKECLLEAIERGDRAAEADLSAKLVPLYVGLAAGGGGGGGGGGPPPSAPATSRGSTPGNGPERSDAAAAAAQAKARAAAEAAWEAHQAQALEEAYRALEGRSEDEIAHLELEDPAFLARCAPAQAAHYAGRCRRLAGQWGLPDPARGLGGGGGDNDESTLGTGMASSEYYGTGSFDSRTNSMDSDNKMDDENEDDDQKTEHSENQEFLDKEHQEQEDEDDDDSNNN